MVLEPSARTQTKPEFDDTNSKIAAVVNLITKYGPEINRISRELGIHKETVRYWYKERLLRRGHTVQAVPNHEKLGLQRVVAIAEFSEMFKPFADAILMAMSELCYLNSFAKTLPDDLYSIQASVPREYVGEWLEFMSALKRRGLFSSVKAISFEWVRVVPMRSDMYDFENDMWHYDWTLKPNEPGFVDNHPSEKGKFDLIDLNMIKQMQLDPDATLIETQQKLQMNYKTLTWHYRNHLVENGLIKGYLVNWAGTRYDPRLEKALHRRHSYMWLELYVSSLTESERIELMAKISRLPFVWLEAGGRRNYFAQMAFPIETMTEALVFIKEAVSSIKGKATWHFMDQANALRFTMVPSLYDEKSRKWKFDQADLLNRFDRLVLEIKGTTS